MAKIRRTEAVSAIEEMVRERLRWCRESKGCTLAQVASAAGISLQSLQKYESGAARIPAGILGRVAQVLGVSPAFFFEEGDRESASWPEDAMKLIRFFVEIRDDKVRASFVHLMRATALSSMERADG